MGIATVTTAMDMADLAMAMLGTAVTGCGCYVQGFADRSPDRLEKLDDRMQDRYLLHESRRGGESPAAAAGRRAHKNYGTALGASYETEVRLPSGKIADAIDWVAGIKSRITGKVWKAVLDVYKGTCSK